MPCLTAYLIKSNTSLTTDDEILLDGQVSAWKIRMSNVGKAPATNISLKTSRPWVSIVETTPIPSFSTEDRDAAATSRCVGPSGTLMTIPIRGNNLEEEGVLHPGETVEIPILLRTSGGGKREFYMLYRYERKDSLDRSSENFRWLKRMYEVPVSQ